MKSVQKLFTVLVSYQKRSHFNANTIVMFQVSFRGLVFLIEPNFQKMFNIFQNISSFIGTNLYKHQRYDLRCKRVRGRTRFSKLSRNFQNKLKSWMYEGNQYIKIQSSSIWFLIQNWLPLQSTELGSQPRISAFLFEKWLYPFRFWLKWMCILFPSLLIITFHSESHCS